MKRFVVVLVLAMLVAMFGTNLVAAASTAPAAAAAAPAAATAATHNVVYYVQYGDTLAKIAQRYGTTVWAIWHANPWIKNPNLIYPGQRLIVPVPGPAPQFTNVKVGLIALEGGGGVGCGDSVVLVNRQVPATTAPLTAAIQQLLSLKDQYYGQSGLYNALYQSNLRIQSVTIVNGVAIIKLTGTLSLGGECDDPRVQAQFDSTAKQFSNVKTVKVYINGIPLENLLGGKGA